MKRRGDSDSGCLIIILIFLLVVCFGMTLSCGGCTIGPSERVKIVK